MTTTTTNESPTLRDKQAPWKWPLFGICVILMVVSFIFMPDYADDADKWGYGLRVTARLAFAFLMLAYIARPLKQLFGIGDVLIRHRRYLGLSMALAHTVHFFCVWAVVAWHDLPLEVITVLFGAPAFLLMWAMAATSNDASMRRLKKNWKRLHTLGLHYLWVIFMQSFVGRVGADDPYYLYLILTLLGLAGLGLRVWAYWARRAT